MKTKYEILKMNKHELRSYKWSDDLNLKKEKSDCSLCFDCVDCVNCSLCFDCVDCVDCSLCFDCVNCSTCSDCFNCRNLKDGNKHQYKICNVQLTKEEYEKKMKELKEKSK